MQGNATNRIHVSIRCVGNSKWCAHPTTAVPSTHSSGHGVTNTQNSTIDSCCDTSSNGTNVSTTDVVVAETTTIGVCVQPTIVKRNGVIVMCVKATIVCACDARKHLWAA